MIKNRVSVDEIKSTTEDFIQRIKKSYENLPVTIINRDAPTIMLKVEYISSLVANTPRMQKAEKYHYDNMVFHVLRTFEPVDCGDKKRVVAVIAVRFSDGRKVMTRRHYEFIAKAANITCWFRDFNLGDMYNENCSYLRDTYSNLFIDSDIQFKICNELRKIDNRFMIILINTGRSRFYNEDCNHIEWYFNNGYSVLYFDGMIIDPLMGFIAQDAELWFKDIKRRNPSMHITYYRD